MKNLSYLRNKAFVLTGLGSAIAIAVFLSPFASKNPDGLERVAQEHHFEKKAQTVTSAQKLPFRIIFDEYALQGVPTSVATPLAGLSGTLVTFGLAWGLGKVLERKTNS